MRAFDYLRIHIEFTEFENLHYCQGNRRETERERERKWRTKIERVNVWERHWRALCCVEGLFAGSLHLMYTPKVCTKGVHTKGVTPKVCQWRYLLHFMYTPLNVHTKEPFELNTAKVISRITFSFFVCWLSCIHRALWCGYLFFVYTGQCAACPQNSVLCVHRDVHISSENV